MQPVDCSNSTVTSAAQFANNGYGRYERRRVEAACVLGRSPACLVTASQQAEAQFAVRNITADNTKYYYVVAALDQATAHKPSMLFESIFLRCMPEDIHLQLATSSFDDLRALAKTAGELWQAREQSAVVFTSNTRTKRSATRRPATTTSSGESPARDRDVCFYHQRFGDAARKCVQPCTFAGNDRAGRQ